MCHRVRASERTVHYEAAQREARVGSRRHGRWEEVLEGGWAELVEETVQRLGQALAASWHRAASYEDELGPARACLIDEIHQFPRAQVVGRVDHEDPVPRARSAPGQRCQCPADVALSGRASAVPRAAWGR